MVVKKRTPKNISWVVLDTGREEAARLHMRERIDTRAIRRDHGDLCPGLVRREITHKDIIPVIEINLPMKNSP